MLEAILFGGKSSIYLPYSGPGNKAILAGGKTNGWFGLVDLAQMPTIQQVAESAGLVTTPYNTSTLPTNPAWLKAMLDGKAVFVPNRPMVNNVTWAAIYNAGLVYGTDDTGPVKPANLNPVNQLRYFEWTAPDGSSWLFKIRLLRDNVPLLVAATSDVTSTSMQDSEQYTLFSHIYTGGQPKDIVQWDKLGQADMWAFQTFGQTIAANGNIHTFTSNGQPGTGAFYSPTGVNLVWLPALEVVDPTENLIFALGVKLVNPNAITVASTPSSKSLNTPQDTVTQPQTAVPASATASSSSLTAPGGFTTTNSGMRSVAPTFN